MTTRLGPQPPSFPGARPMQTFIPATWYIMVPPFLLFLSVRKRKSKRIRKDLFLWEAEKWYRPNRSRRIKERWQEYTEELYKKDLHNPDNHNGVITDLEPDILECEVKWTLESITTNKASGGDGIPVELFQILKDDAVKVLHSICQ